MIVVADYGAGNLHSIGMGLRRRGLEVQVTDDPRAVDAAAALVVPGDGAFGPAIARLRDSGFAERIVAHVRSGRPFLGVCLGMQLLFEESVEGGSHRGLGVLPGRVIRLPETVKVPHMGWNQLQVLRLASPRAGGTSRRDLRPASPLLEGVSSGAYVYFVHSYYCLPANPGLVAATASYGAEIAAVVGGGNVWATQFHPEKSGKAGEQILNNFARWAVGVGTTGG